MYSCSRKYLRNYFVVTISYQCDGVLDVIQIKRFANQIIQYSVCLLCFTSAFQQKTVSTADGKGGNLQ